MRASRASHARAQTGCVGEATSFAELAVLLADRIGVLAMCARLAGGTAAVAGVPAHRTLLAGQLPVLVLVGAFAASIAIEAARTSGETAWRTLLALRHAAFVLEKPRRAVVALRLVE